MGGGDGNAKIDAWLGLLLARDKKQTPNYTLLLCVFILLTLVRTAELASSTPSSSVALFIPSFTHVTCTHTHINPTSSGHNLSPGKDTQREGCRRVILAVSWRIWK